jgi:hypothetical protein
LFLDGAISRLRGNLRRAEGSWSKCAAVLPAVIRAASVPAEGEGFSGDFDEALLDSVPADLGLLFVAQGRYGDAINCWRQGADLTGSVACLTSLGDLYLSQGRVDDIPALIERLHAGRAARGLAVTRASADAA